MTAHLVLAAAHGFHLHGKGWNRLALAAAVVALIVFFRSGKKGKN